MGRRKSSGGIFAAIAGVIVAIVGLGMTSKLANWTSASDKKPSASDKNNESTDSDFDVHVHEWELLFHTDSTCESKGYNEYECVCGETSTEELPLLDHVWSRSEEIAAATCTTGSTVRYYCANCDGSKTETMSYNALGHISVPAQGTATCTGAGYTSGTYCSRCNVVLSGMEEVESLGHEFTEHIGHLDATCGADGYVELGCTRCDVTQRTTLPATGLHAIGGTIESIPATCYAEGYNLVYCSTCATEWKETFSKMPHIPDADAVCTTCGTLDLSLMSYYPKTTGNYKAMPIQEMEEICGKWLSFSLGSTLKYGAEESIVYDAEGLRYAHHTPLTGETVYYDITQQLIPSGSSDAWVFISTGLKYWTDDTHTSAASVGVWSSASAQSVTGTVNVLTEFNVHSHSYAGGVCSCGAFEVDPFAGLGASAEQTIKNGELMVGNWYRVYRDSAIAIQGADFNGLYCDSESKNNWGNEGLVSFYSSELCFFVYDNYYDFYVIPGTFSGLYEAPMGGTYVSSFTISAMAMVDYVNGTAYRLEIPCEHSYNAANVCTKCGKVSADYAADMQEVDVAVGELVAGNWYRVYRGGCAVLDTPEMFAGIQANTGNDYPLGRLGNLIDRACPDLTYVVTEEYIDFYLAPGAYATYFVGEYGALTPGDDFIIGSTTAMSDIQGTVKRLVKA